MPKQIQLISDAHERVDRFVTSHLGEGIVLSRAKVKKLIEAGDLLVNGQSILPSHTLHPGDKISLTLNPEANLSIEPENIPLQIIFEDKDIIVIDKPAGMVVHPAVGHSSGTLVNALMYHLGRERIQTTKSSIDSTDESLRAGIVHRLDKDTSGVMVVAKNMQAQNNLKEQFQTKEVQKSYLALLNGRLDKKDGIIDEPIGRHLKNRQKFTIRNDGKKAVTIYKTLKEYPKYSLVEASPVTGRTHQIRVHFASLGNSVVGDSTYGKKNPEFSLGRHFLHAAVLKFNHPITGESLEFKSNLPEELNSVLLKLDSK